MHRSALVNVSDDEDDLPSLSSRPKSIPQHDADRLVSSFRRIEAEIDRIKREGVPVPSETLRMYYDLKAMLAEYGLDMRPSVRSKDGFEHGRREQHARPPVQPKPIGE
jgi:hypothetical protein